MVPRTLAAIRDASLCEEVSKAVAAIDSPVERAGLTPVPAASLEVGATVIWLAGEQDLTAIAALRDTVAQLVKHPGHDPDVVIDLESVSFIGGQLVGAILEAKASLRQNGRTLTLRAPTRAAYRLLVLCGLEGMVQVSADLQNASSGATASVARHREDSGIPSADTGRDPVDPRRHSPATASTDPAATPELVASRTGMLDRRAELIGSPTRETSMEAERAALRLTLDIGRMGAWQWEAATGVMSWDAQQEMLHGLGPSEFDRTFDGWTSLIHADDVAAVQATLLEGRSDEGDFWLENRVVHPDGTIRWIQTRGRVLVTLDGSVTGMVGCSVDATDVVEARLEIARVHAALDAHARRTAELSETLQEALLPQLIEVDGFHIVVRYRPGEQRLLLGGDFLDLAVTPDGNLGFVIGDVVGHGPRPAALGASLRAAWRGAALTNNDPAVWLETLELVLRSSGTEIEMFATVLTGTVAHDGTIRLVSAGHPVPLLIDDAVISLEPEVTLPLGFDSPARVSAVVTTMSRTGTPVCFTDGLFEGRAEPGSSERYGEERIAQWLTPRNPDVIDGSVIDALLRELERANGVPLPDDVAVLTIRLCEH